MSTTVIFSSNDGRIASQDATYSVARAGADLSTATGSVGSTGQNEFEGGVLYGCNEAFLTFDTSAVDTAPDLATLSICSSTPARSPVVAPCSFQARMRVYGGSLTNADFVPGASLSALTLVAHVDGATLVDATYSDLVDDGLAGNIVLSGSTQMLVTADTLVSGVVPAPDTQEMWQVIFSAAAGTTQDPKVTLTFLDPTVAGPTDYHRFPKPMLRPN